jgi:hypothetical protein
VTILAPDLPEAGPAVCPPGAMTRWLAITDPERLFELLTRDLRDDAFGIASSEKPGRIRAAERALYLCEREEEELVEAALAQGLPVARRSDASGYAVLGIAPPAMADEMLSAQAAE